MVDGWSLAEQVGWAIIIIGFVLNLLGAVIPNWELAFVAGFPLVWVGVIVMMIPVGMAGDWGEFLKGIILFPILLYILVSFFLGSILIGLCFIGFNPGNRCRDI
jgi:hypothetical protein